LELANLITAEKEEIITQINMLNQEADSSANLQEHGHKHDRQIIPFCTFVRHHSVILHQAWINGAFFLNNH
jgi:hypothetical protein